MFFRLHSLAATLVLLPFWWHVVLYQGSRPELYLTYQSVILYAGDFTLALTLAAWGMDRFLRPRTFVRPPIAITALLLAFLSWSALSVLWSQEPRLTLGYALHLLLLTGILFYLANDSPPPAQLALWLTVGLTIQALIALAEVSLQSGHFLQPLGLLWPGDLLVARSGTSVVENAAGARWLRAYGTLPHPNILGGYLLVYLVGPTLGYLRTGRKGWVVVWLLGVSVFLLSFSRAAWAGGLAAGLSLVWLLPASFRLRALTLAVAAIPALLALSWALPGVFFARIAPVPEEGTRLERSSSEERTRFNDAALRIWRRHPWAGVGAGAYMIAASDLPQLPAPLEPAHSVGLLAAAELGIVGLFLVAGLAGAVGGGIWLRRRQDGPSGALFGAALVGIGVTALFDHFWWTLPPGRDLLWLAIGLWLRSSIPGKGGQDHGTCIRGRCAPATQNTITSSAPAATRTPASTSGG